jgi:hypothetical protein
VEVDPIMAFTPRLLAAVVSLTAAAAPAPADEPKGGASAGNALVGTWRLVTAKYGGKEHRFPDGTTTLKHVTPTQFMWVSHDQDGKIWRTAGGGYTIRGTVYEETPGYGMSSDFGVIRGKAQTFAWKLDGNRWLHTGKLSNGLTIDEVWERVEKK